jgi:UDP-glucose 4-epimerase
LGTIQVVQKCLAHRVPRLLYASSMTAYGHPLKLPIQEDMACQPISYYGITKYASERYVHATSARIDLDAPFQVTSFRMFNVYGERQRLDNPYQGVMGIFIGNLVRGEPIVIHGDGEQSRDFVFIGDVVEAWIRAWNDSAAYGQVFNLGRGTRYSINQLAETILAAFGRSRETYSVEHAPLRPGDQRHMVADISKARQVLGWQPQISFEEGVQRTVRWAMAGQG